jgi:hypothetical protein
VRCEIHIGKSNDSKPAEDVLGFNDDISENYTRILPDSQGKEPFRQ